MIEVPSLLLQPLVENAIKHGVATLHEKGIIILMFYSQNKDLIIDINDNGKGFQTQTTGTGLGLKLTNERIQLFNQSFRQQLIHISIKSDEINGTAVHLIFKNWL
jgi:LytS/YehU family sensor histidine kinase